MGAGESPHAGHTDVMPAGLHAARLQQLYPATSPSLPAMGVEVRVQDVDDYEYTAMGVEVRVQDVDDYEYTAMGVEVRVQDVDDYEYTASCCPADLDAGGVSSSACGGRIQLGARCGSSSDMLQVPSAGTMPSASTSPPVPSAGTMPYMPSTPPAKLHSDQPTRAAAPALAPAPMPILRAGHALTHQSSGPARGLLASGAPPALQPSSLSGTVMDAQLLYFATAIPGALVQLMPGGVSQGGGMCIYVAANTSDAGASSQDSSGRSQMVC